MELPPGGGGMKAGFYKAWFSCGGGVGSWVGLHDLKGLFQPGSSCSSLILEVV